MKKILVTLLFSLTVFATDLFAVEGTEIDPKILSAFQKEFSQAQNVKWEDKGELKQVSFSLYDHRCMAWYGENAELVSTARNLLYMQLPLSVIKTLEQKYSNADFSAITEVTRADETYYQIKAEVKNKRFLLKATLMGTVVVLKKIE